MIGTRWLLVTCIWTSVIAYETEENVQEAMVTTESPDDSKISYQGSQVISICHNDTAKFSEFTQQLLKDKDFEFWGKNETCSQFFVQGDKVEDVKLKLQKNDLPFVVVIEDLQRAIDTENPPIDDEQIGKVGHREGFLIKPIIEFLLWAKDPIRKSFKPFSYIFKADSVSSSSSSNSVPLLPNKLSVSSFRILGHNMNWVSYHRLADIYGYLDYLAQTYPDLVQVGTLGTSVEGRLLKYAKISSGKPNAKSFWIDGGIHAREWISPATVSYILYELVENRDAHLKEVDGIDFYIMPVMNPDGYEYTHIRDRLWRKNRNKGGYYCQGTDLNRNWGYKWGGKGSSQQQCQEIYGGKTAFSEPETRAASNFIQYSVPNAKGFLTFHSYGQYILYPYGFDNNQLPPDHRDLERVGRKMATAIRQVGGSSYRVGNSANSLYPASGGADDWAKGVAGIKYTYTIELRDTGRYGFVLPSQFIQPTAKEALAAVKVMSAEIQALP